MRVFAILSTITLAAPAFAADPPVDFTRDILPVLQKSCFECHGAKKQRGGLRLDSRAAALKGGDGGAAVVAGKPEASELLRRVALAKNHEDVMPPRGETLSKEQVKILRAWIAAGAKWPDATKKETHWAYVKPQRPAVPTFAKDDITTRFVRNPIDAFVLQRLKRKGLSPSAEAPKEVLLRRLSLDLIGLPPTPAEVEAFVKDTSPDAYEKQVGRLLASPQFGVKWARSWLDAARYADSHGFQRDDFRDLWPYRDWVVDALNADMPFDRFTVEQLAGDLLPKPTQDQLVATGFNRSAPTNVEAGTEPEETRTNQVFDRVNTLGTVWLGTTLECCQCHDHKYDPFTARDYYRLFAFFNNTELEADRTNPKVPGSIAFRGPTLTLDHGAVVAVKKRLQEQIAAARKAGAKKVITQLQAKISKLKPPTTLIMKELPKPRPTHIFKRGDYRTPGEKVSPGTPGVLPPMKAGSTRLELAKWLVSQENPLTARVTVNRLWGELFGQGLVRTPEDFGIKGEKPTHPEVLDWLAVEFRESWSIKKLIETIVMSGTYRQSARVSSKLLALDDRNLLLARGPRFRLSAEGIRDNALAIAGLISLRQGGSPIRPYQPDGVWVKVGGQRYAYVVSAGEDKYRRGLYVVLKRGAPYPSFMNFDATNRMACRVKRPRSNTPLQALTLLNDPVYVEATMAFAKRVLVEQPGGPADRIDYAFRVAVARRPRSIEAAILKKLFEAELDAMMNNPAQAKKLVGTFSLPPKVSPAEFAAWYAVCAAILNLDETITKG